MTDPSQSPPSQWFGEWMRSEKFWHEVATRTLAGIFAGAVLAGLGALAVVFSNPLNPDISRVALLVLMTVSLFVGISSAIGSVFNIVHQKKEGLPIEGHVRALVLFLIAAITAVLAITLALVELND